MTSNSLDHPFSHSECNEPLTPPRYAEMVKRESVSSQGLLLRSVAMTGIPTPKRPSRSDKLHLMVETVERKQFLPIYTVEEVQRSESIPLSRRRASLSFVQKPVQEETAVCDRKSGRIVLFPSGFRPEAQNAVYTQTSFVGKQYLSQSNGNFPVQIHIYDLSQGLIGKHSKDILGKQYMGVYHSAIVVFGLEFYFEGGVGYAQEGLTRFGEKFKTIILGTTTKSLPQFLKWFQEKERTTLRLHDYHPVRHNCHHFTRKAAQYLLDCDEDPLPSYLFSTTKELSQTAVGAPILEVLQMTTQGTQHAVARILRSRVLERMSSVDMLINSVTACGVLHLPPTVAILFRVDDKVSCKRAVLGIMPFVEMLIKNGVIKEKAREVVVTFSNELVRGCNTLSSLFVSDYLEITHQALLSTPLTLWGPIFNSLRIAALHKQITIGIVFHKSLVSLLMTAARDFPRLLPIARVNFLRLMCNICSHTHGALLLHDARYVSTWVAVVGLGLMDLEHDAITYTAACLAVNLANVIVINTTPSLKREMGFQGDRHCCAQLTTILLYNLKFRTEAELSEPVFNMLLLAIYRIMSSNSKALEYVSFHAFKLNYMALLKRSRSNESRALLCIMKTFQDLYN